MKLTKHDIGAEIISILTRGMYPDPRDAVREYIQNAIDAKSKNVEVKVRQRSVVVEDDGFGMSHETLRKSIRLGVSDKVPGKHVGFMGIGIYSAFHLCDSLTIYTRQAKALPSMLQMNFRGMRDLLADERTRRLENKIDGDRLTDLQTLLEDHISFSEEDELPGEEFPVPNGTRVELEGLDPVLDEPLNDFEQLSDYLRDVVPLRFDKDNFLWAENIENHIQDVCEANGASFDIINLRLESQGHDVQLYRPYRNEDFDDDLPKEPKYKEIKQGSKFLGIAWGCLNSARRRISNKDLRGFLLKKQGFSIGKRENLAKYFGHSNQHFDRYVGEIIVTHHDLLPNAARNNLEVSSLQKWFFKEVTSTVATYFNGLSDDFQNFDRTREILDEQGNRLKQVYARFNEAEENPDNLIDALTELAEIKRKLTSARSKAKGDQKATVTSLEGEVTGIKELIQARVDFLVRQKKPRTKLPDPPKAKASVGKGLAGYDANKPVAHFETLADLIKDLELDLSEDAAEFLTMIDEKFVQAVAKNKQEYYELLNELRNDFENRLV